MEQIPADLLRVYVPGRNLAEVLPNLRAHVLQHDRLRDRAHLQPRAARVAARAHRVRASTGRRSPWRTGSDCSSDSPRSTRWSATSAPRSSGRRRSPSKGSTRSCPMLETLLTHASRTTASARWCMGMSHRGRLAVVAHVANHSYESILNAFELASARREIARFASTGRREVPHRRNRHLSHRERQGDPRPPAAKPEPPRGDRPGGRGMVPRGADPASRDDAAPRSDGGAARADPRRCRVRRAGRRAGGAQPAVAARLHDRRDRALHRRQPGRLHHRPAGRAVDPLRLRPRQGLRHPHRSRQRRRRRGVPGRGHLRLRLPPRVSPRRHGAPDRLPPLRSQRGRRAGVHATAHVPEDPPAPDGARDLRGAARRRRA